MKQISFRRFLWLTCRDLSCPRQHCACFYRVSKTFQIEMPLPPRIDPVVAMFTVEEKTDITYNDIGGCKEQILKIREVSLF